MAIYDKGQRTLRHNFSEMTPSERAKQGQKDYEMRAQHARASAEAENKRREAAQKRVEMLKEENLYRLVAGDEVKTLMDAHFIIGLVNHGEEDINYELERSLDTYFERMLEQEVNALRREYMKKRNELDDIFLSYVQRDKGSKRSCKKILATLSETPYGPITKKIDAIVNGDKGE